MSNYSVLKQDINNNIYENQTQQITGTVLNAILNEMTASLGAGYQFAGVATVGMNPGDPDQRVFYLAGEGIYTSFGGIQVPAGKLGVLKWDNRWTLQTIDGLGSGGANLTGYVTVASTDDLPDEGVATLGYLCGTNLYLYVGEGGDTKEGKYQDCGSFRGPQGDSVQDVEQTQTSLENGGVNKIKFTLSNGISCEFQVRNGTTSSGLFPTLEALQAAYPSPVVGQYAFVGVGFPADIYVCTTAGTWTDSGEDYDGDNVDLTDYATKAELNQLEAELDGSSGRVVTNTNFNDTGKFLYGTGTLDSASYNITDYIDIEGCEEIIVTNVWDAPNGILSYVIYDSAKSILATNPTPDSAGNRNYDITTIPAGAKYIRCTQNYLYSSSVEIHYPGFVGLKSRVSTLETETESLDGRVTSLEDGQLDINIQDTITAKNQITDFTTYSDTHLNTTNGQTASSTSFICSDFIPILPETDYTCGKVDATYGGYKVRDMQEICYYNESKAFLSATTSKRTITSPSGAKFLRFSVLSTTYSESLGTDSISELEIVQGTSPISVFGRDVFGDILPLNGLKGKKWLLIGDSNTEHNFRANGKYDDFIASYTGVVPTNIGVSGAGFRVYENASLVYLNILNSFITNNPTYKPDFITIMGGTNDVNFDGSNIGTYTDETTSTVFGYMYLLVQRIKEAYPNVPFAICTQFPQNYGDASKQTLLTSFVQGEMDFCKYRNIPCLDLFFCSGLRPEESGFNAHYYSCSSSPNGDGIHLNYYGQKLISARIREFLMSFFGEL